VLKLGDFGLSINAMEELPIERLGTLDYMAPEILAIPRREAVAAGGDTAVPYDWKVDVWAVGVLGFELIDGRPPFEVESEELTCAMIMWGEIEEWPEDLSHEGRCFLESAMCKDPVVRPSVEELLQHPWVTGYAQSA
jgi:serine/threonine protein kinase